MSARIVEILLYVKTFAINPIFIRGFLLLLGSGTAQVAPEYLDAVVSVALLSLGILEIALGIKDRSAANAEQDINVDKPLQ